MNRRAILAIVRKDLMVVRQSRAVMAPLLIVPVIFLVGMPLLASFAPSLINLPGSSDFTALLAQLPPELTARFAGLSEEAQVLKLLVTYLFAPLYLIVPLMVVSVIAADAFAGEKERRTLEALLYTPTSDRELLFAKALAAYIPAILIAWVGFAVYALVANLAGWRVIGEVFFPTPMWWMLAGWVAPGVAALGLSATVLVSARVSTFQEAYQLGAVVVIPIVALVAAQATGLVILSSWIAIVLGGVAWALAAVLWWLGTRSFSRDRLLTRSA